MYSPGTGLYVVACWRPPIFLSSGYWVSFPGGKSSGQWSWPLTSI